jgi:NADPH:quinone reductase-like Zn-dependent oxidoreductase
MSYQRIIISRFGGPEVLNVTVEDDLPTPKDGEVRLKMLATSACFTDTMIRNGRYFGNTQKPPFSPGYDVVGVVDALGPGVTNLQVGQRVAELTVTGAYAEYLCLPASQCVPVPLTLDPAEAVSMVLTYITAYQMLHRIAKVQRGARILIHGASGAVGTALIQLGRLHDLEMYGTAAQANHDIVASLGATPIDYQHDDFVARMDALTPRGADAVFDAIGGRHFQRSWRCVRRGGILVAYGAYYAAIGKEGGAMWSYTDLMIRNLWPNGKAAAIYSIASLKQKHPDWFREDLTELFELLEQSKIQPVIAHRLKLTDAAEAHRLLESRGVRGKIVLLA